MRTLVGGGTPGPCWGPSESSPLGAAAFTSAKGLLGIACLSSEVGMEVLCESERANWWAAALSAAAPKEGPLPTNALPSC